MMAKTAQTELRSFRRPPRLGDFIEHFGNNKLRLTECPLCALDPDRDRHLFERTSHPENHFHHEHGPDDVGRPMAELLPDRPVAAVTDGGERRG